MSQFRDVSLSSLDAWRSQHPATRTNAEPEPAPPGRNWLAEHAAADAQVAADFQAIQGRHAASREAERVAAAALAEQRALDAQAAVIRRALSGEPLLTPSAPTRAETFRARFAAARTPQEAEAVFRDMQASYG